MVICCSHLCTKGLARFSNVLSSIAHPSQDSEFGMRVFNHPYDQIKDLHNQRLLLELFMHDSTLRNAIRYQTVTQKPARPFERLFWTGFHDLKCFFTFGFREVPGIDSDTSGISQSFCAVHPDTMKIFASFLFFQRTLDRDHSLGKNGLDQGCFLHAHTVLALTWTTSIDCSRYQ